MRSPSAAPNLNLYRFVTANDDATSLGNRVNGIHVGGFTSVLFQIVPINTATPPEDFSGVALGTSNPVVTVYSWNAALDTYVPLLPSPVPASPGAGKAYAFSVNAYGGILMVGVTGVAALEGVAIFTSGFQH
jgi:hypothetical protein